MRRPALARLGRIGKSVARIALWATAVVVMLALALLLALRTGPGRRAILRVALPLVNAKMAAHLSVHGIDGDVLDHLVLIDARLDDAEGLEAIYARRVEVWIDWRALWHKRVHLRDLRVEGGRLTLRHLRDNRFNLAAMGKPRSEEQKKKDAEAQAKKPKKEPPLVEIDHFTVQVDGAYHPPLGHETHTGEWPRGTFDIQGAATFKGADMHFRVDRLVSEAHDPLHAHVELRGGLKVTPHGTPVGKAELTFEDVAVTVITEGDEIAHLNAALHPRGRWQLHAEGGGPLSDLHAQALLSGPAGSVSVVGQMGRMFPGIRWRASVVASGLDPGLDWRNMPRGQIDLALAGAGVRNEGAMVLERLLALADGVRVEGQGHSDFRGHGDGELRASLDSLARIGDMGVRVDGVDELDGRVAVTATLGRDAAGPRVDATVRAGGLWMRHGRLKTKARMLEAHAQLGPTRPLTLRLATRDVEIDGVGIARRAQPLSVAVREANVVVRGDLETKRFAVELAAAMPDGARGRAGLHAHVGDDAIDVRLDSTEVSYGGRRYVLPEPAAIHVTGSGPRPHIVARVAGARIDTRVHFGHERLTVDARLDVADLARLTRASAIRLSGAAHARANLDLGEHLRIDARVEADRVHGPHVAIERLTVTLRSVDLVGDARVEGSQLKLGTMTLGKLVAHARASRDRFTAVLSGEHSGARGATRLRVDVDGTWHTDGLRLVDADLVVRDADLDLPAQSWRLAEPAHLVAHDGRVTLRGLRARSGLGELGIDGRFERGGIDVTVALRDGDLEELSRATGHPGLLPSARWSGRVHVAGTPTAPLVDAQLDARAAQTVAWYGLGFNAVHLSAYADSRHAILHADARGHGDTRIVVDVHGTPRQDDGRFVAIASTLDRVQLSVHGHRWELRDPCVIDVAERLSLSSCRLGSGRAEIALSGAAPLSSSSRDPAFDLTLSTRHLDLRDLFALLAPGHQEPPKTDFDIRAHLAGTRVAPVVDVALSGRGSEIDEGGLPENVNYKISAHWEANRVRGQASMRQAGMSLGIGATFDLPTKLDGREQPIQLALEARPVPFFKIRQLLPPALADLRGFFSLRLTATGTTRNPNFRGELHMPSWGLDNLKDNNTVVNMAYDGQELVLNSVTSFEAQSLIGSLLRLHPPRNSGTVTMELRAPVDFVRLVHAPRDALHALVHDAPLTASAEVRDVDLRKVPLQLLGFDTPLTRGRVDGAVRFAGTLHRPSLHADVHALNLGKPGVIEAVDVDGSVAWEAGRIKLSGSAGLRGAPLLTFSGQAQLDGRRLFDGDGWQNGTLAIDIDVPKYDLTRLRNLQPRLHAIDGTMRAGAQIRGTWAVPDLFVTAHGRDVGLSHARFARIDGEARLADRRWRFTVDGDQVEGGRAHVAGELSRDWNRPMSMSIETRALDVGFLGALWEEIGDVHGILDARVEVGGTRAHPEPSGWATLERGTFNFRHDPRRYEAALVMRVDGTRATLNRLSLRSGDGTLEATGKAQLDGLWPTELSLSAKARRFEAAYGSASARFDADFEVAGSRTDGAFRGQLKLDRGSIQLPDLTGVGVAQRTDALADVRYDDARAQKTEAGREAGRGVFIAARIDGPLELRSREADLDLVGDLAVNIAGGALGIDGVVEARRGTMELLGRRYDVDRAMLAFSGRADNPELHVRVTRRIGAATVAVVIEGNAKNPEVHLSCEPPVYDQSQLVGLILAGQPHSDRIGIHELQQQITGLLSALVIRKIQEQLAPTLPVDVSRPLDVQSYAEFSQSPLELGRFVSDRIYVRYGQRSGSRLGRSAANAEEASAEYRLGKGFQLSTTFGDAGVGGVYLFWTKKN
ncbi:MAG: hypothetical protein JWN44_2054 [Myxococcales bacterium]|nr:hypothetical protein [Myxococcales bacterium]